MNKKCQAAMEFLMTYGWVILFVLAAIGALAYFGILNPDRILPEKCTMQSGISCLDFNNNDFEITLSMHNSVNLNMINTTLTLIPREENIKCSTFGHDIHENGKTKNYHIICDNMEKNKKFITDIHFDYFNELTKSWHAKTGELIIKIH